MGRCGALGRSAASSELDQWQNQRRQGTSRSDVARGFLYSPEHLGTVADGYYQQWLHRGVDATGRAGFINAVRRGFHDEQLVTSPEYLSCLPS